MKTKEDMNLNKNCKIKKGISLIVLVITIIVIIILATAVIVTILDNNPISSAIRAVDDSNVAKYTEQIEQVRSKLLLQNENHELPNLSQMKEALEKEKWVVQTEMIMDESVEKLKIVSKEGYIFYITEDGVEYKGKGEVVDTSALKRDDVLELVAQEETTNGQYVKITSKAEEYYVIKYKIGEEENNWTEIKSGEKVEVPFGKTIYAKLFYGSSSGVEFKLKIGEINPSIVAKNINTSNMKRKSDNVFASLFDITWGSEGIGKIKYEVTGNMLFNNTSYSNTQIGNTKELEVGTYNVKCTITSPGGYETSAIKQVKINQLANTTVTNASNSNVNANAIYSEYDLAYFRDLVNGGQFNINGKIMNNINLINVCSSSIGNWTPIGEYNPSVSLGSINEATIYYNGIFDGDNNKIENIYISNNNLYRQGLFAIIKSNAIIKNIEISGSISAKQAVAGIVGWSYGIISNCTNKVDLTANICFAGGITARNSGRIENCMSDANIHGQYLVGEIAGRNDTTITDCYSQGTVTATGACVWISDGSTGEAVESLAGGIVGHNYGTTTRCINKSIVTSARKVAGGIAGRNLRNSFILL